MKLIYPAIFTPYDEDGEKGYVVVFPDLPGCSTGGDSLGEALEMAEDAASGWILTSIEDGETIPQASRIQDVHAEEEGAFVNLVRLDIGTYAKLHSNKAVKKTLTIPQWLNTVAEKEGVKFSKILQEALLASIHASPKEMTHQQNEK